MTFRTKAMIIASVVGAICAVAVTVGFRLTTTEALLFCMPLGVVIGVFVGLLEEYLGRR